MANAREIQSRMKSIKDTMKITNAMYMISSSKLKRAKKVLSDTEPYFYSIQTALIRILRHFPDIENPYFDTRPEVNPENRKIGYIVITADKGLAGSYNHNIIKLAQECLDKGGNNELFILGMVGRQYFTKKNIEIAEQFRYTVQKPTMSRARRISERIIDLFLTKELDEVHIIYTRMISGIQTEAEVVQLLPLQKHIFNNMPTGIPMEQIAFSPSPVAVINSIAPNYVSGFIYGALVESYSSEQSQRMMAMEAATKSAKDMIHDLAIIYNRVRQAAITQEITEIVSGAKAQKNKKKK